jgi:single-strand DNA-binding protein
MASLNRWQGIGNLGANAEVSVTRTGKQMCKFRIAVTEKYKTESGEKKEETTWVPCVLWGPRGAALAQYLTRGKQVLVEGRFHVSTQEADGKKTFYPDINVTDVQLLGGRSDSAQPAPRTPAPRGGNAPAAADDGFDDAGVGDDSFPF